MTTPSPATYGLLGMLATRSWTGYELTQQIRRSLRFIWPLSEGHLYREQKRLVELGWVTVGTELAGGRTRKRYTITAAGRIALQQWLSTEPEEPRLQVEGILRTFVGDQGEPAQLAASMRCTAAMAGAMLDELYGFVEEYLQPEGPLAMLEQGVGGPGAPRREFHGRPMFPERLHVVALSIDVTTRLLETIERFFTEAAEQVAAWPGASDPSITPQTRAVLERIRGRNKTRG